MSYLDDILTVSTENLPWEKLSGKNILITGGTGLIGSCLVDVLMNHPGIDFNVYAAGRNERRAESRFSKYMDLPYFHFLKYDVQESLVCEVDFHYIVYAAGGATPVLYSTDPVGVMKSNLQGVDSLLQYAICHNLQKFVYVSSCDVYGVGEVDEFTEEYSGYVNPLNLRSCYSMAKRATETLCISYSEQYNVDVSIARPCHTYGPCFTESDTRVFAQFIRNAVNGEDIVLKSDGSQFRSWCYVADCASGLLHILLKGGDRQAYNIASDASDISIRELAGLVAGFSSCKVVFDTPSSIEKKGFNVVQRSIINTDKLKTLGWRSTVNIKDGMERTIIEVMKNKNV